MITHDPTTWPTGDKIWDICHAIAYAEGADKAGSNPDRLNNPGDVSDYSAAFGFERHSGSNITHFPNKYVGWGMLRWKIERILTGKSTVYYKTFTWYDISRKWAADSETWLNNVTKYLNVPKNSTPTDYVNSPAR